MAHLVRTTMYDTVVLTQQHEAEPWQQKAASAEEQQTASEQMHLSH